MEKYGIKVSNYKCFDKPIGFDEIKPINVIIGKNNSISAIASENRDLIRRR